jgi:hypothetical protein
MYPTRFLLSRIGASRGRTLAAGLAALVLVAHVSRSAVLAADSLPPNPADTTDILASVTLPSAGTQEVLPASRHPFRAGEYLRFSVQYGFIKAGSAYLEVPELKSWNGRKVFNLVARAESNSFFSRFYKVRNRIDSFWDADQLFSWRYAENRREGGYKTKSEIVFDHAKREAHYADGRVFPIPPRVQDGLSSFYFTRFQALPIGGSIVFDYHASKKSLPLEVKIIGRERVETPAGTFNCVAIEPRLKAGGIFKNKGRLVIWITDDERRMPVLMKSQVAVGSISVVLQEFRTPA